MNLDIFTLCDSAHVYDGNMVVVGAKNKIWVSELPQKIPSISLVIRISDEKSFPGDKLKSLQIIAPSGHPLLDVNKFPGVEIEKDGAPIKVLDMNFVLENFPLKEEGIFRAIITFLDDREYTFSFFVCKKETKNMD